MIRHEVDTSHKVNFYSDIYNTKGKNGMRFLQKKSAKISSPPEKGNCNPLDIGNLRREKFHRTTREQNKNNNFPSKSVAEQADPPGTFALAYTFSGKLLFFSK